MSYQFTVSPDFSPVHLAGWYIFNTWLQKQSGLAIHLEMYNDFREQREVIDKGKVDLIYANPFDASMLVREKGFKPLVKALGQANEVIIAVNSDSLVDKVGGLKPELKVAVTDVPDVHMIGMMMLEPADLDMSNVELVQSATNVLVAKNLLINKADAGIFLAEAYDDLSAMIRRQLRVLVRSQVSVIHHSLMVGSKLLDQREMIQSILLDMHNDDRGQRVLKSLGFEKMEQVDDEEMEFMIDLMDTLTV